MHLNFQLCDNERSRKLSYFKSQNYEVGKNILFYRFACLNNLIDKQMLELSLNSFKIKCQELFLTSTEQR